MKVIHGIYSCKHAGKQLRNEEKKVRKRKRSFENDTESEEEEKELLQPIQKRRKIEIVDETNLFIPIKRFEKEKRKKEKYKNKYKQKQKIKDIKDLLKKQEENLKKEGELRQSYFDQLEINKKKYEELKKRTELNHLNYLKELQKLCDLLKERDLNIEEIKRINELELQSDLDKLVKEKKDLEDALALWKEKFMFQSTTSSDGIMNLEKKLKELSFYEKIMDNLTSIIHLMPKNSPLRKELLSELAKNMNDRELFVSKIIVPSGLKGRYWERIKKKLEIENLFLKYKRNVKRDRWSEETKTSFVDILDEIMPFRSGREYRIRTKNLTETHREYQKLMEQRYPDVSAYSYRVFWETFAKRGDRMRFLARNSWCPICEQIRFGAIVEEAKRRNDFSNIDFIWNEDWYDQYLIHKDNHLNEVHNQFKYYQNAKNKIFEEKDENSFIVVQDFSKLDIEKGDTYQDQIFTVYFFDPSTDSILSYKYVHYIDNSKNDKYFHFKSWEALLEDFYLFRKIKDNPQSQYSIILFSDGARKHYKQKFSISWMAFLEKKFENVSFEWNFFLSNHGFNSCDAAGSHAKRRLKWFLNMFRVEQLGSAVNVARCITFEENENVCYKWKGIKNHHAFSLTGLIPERIRENPEMDVNITGISKMHRFVFSSYEEDGQTGVSMTTFRFSEVQNSTSALDYQPKQTILFSMHDLEIMEHFWESIKTTKRLFEIEELRRIERIETGTSVEPEGFDINEEIDEPYEDDGGEYQPPQNEDEIYDEDW